MTTLELAKMGTLADELQTRIERRLARVCVVGLGYVGLPLAETFAWGGYPVLGFDIDRAKIDKLKRGESYIGHICSERVTELVGSGRFDATADAGRFAEADAILICVPTPLSESREPDLSYIEATAQQIAAASPSRPVDRAREHDLSWHDATNCRTADSRGRRPSRSAKISFSPIAPSARIPAIRTTRPAAFPRSSAASSRKAPSWLRRSMLTPSCESCRSRTARWPRPARFSKTLIAP